MYSIDVSECYAGNLGFVHKVTRQCYGRLQGMGASLDYDDVLGDVREAFLAAHAKFDPEQGFEFCTYFGRAAYNKIGRVAEVVEEERIKNGVRSFEELTSDDDLDAIERIASDAKTPDEFLQQRQEAAVAIDKITDGLSPLARVIVEWVVNPPKPMLAEIEKQEAYAAYSRSMGVPCRNSAGVNIGFICKFLRLAMPDVSQKDIAAAGREVRQIIDTL